jgi:RNA polymerase sigma-32 factor
VIAKKLNVTEEDVVSMNRRLSGDASLNAPIRATEGESGEWQDWLQDEADTPEETLVERDELDQRRAMLNEALGVLDKRERRIFEARRLADDPLTLEQLSGGFDVSRERVRQLEVRAFEKVQKSMLKAARDRERGRAALMAPA